MIKQINIRQLFTPIQPTVKVSKHIQILSECDVVSQKQQGREIYYQIEIEKMKEIDVWLERFRKLWEDRFDQLDTVLNNIKTL